MNKITINREFRVRRHRGALCKRPLAVTTPTTKCSCRGRRRAGRRGGTPNNRRGRGRGAASPSWRGGYAGYSPRGTAG